MATTKQKIRRITRNKNFFNSIYIRLISGFLLVGVMFLFAMSVSFFRTNLVLNHNKRVTEIHTPTQKYTHEVPGNLNEIIYILRERIYTPATENPKANRTAANQIKEIWADEVSTSIMELNGLFADDKYGELKDIQAEINKNLQKFYNITMGGLATLDKARINLKSDKKESGNFLLNENLEQVLRTELNPQYIEVSKLFQQLNSKNTIILESENKMLDYYLSILLSFEVFIYLLIVLMMIWITRTLFAYIYRDVQLIYTQVKKMLGGEIPESFETQSKELNLVAQSVNQLNKELAHMKDFSLKVGKGDYTSSMKIFNEKGELGGALSEMKRGLKSISEENQIRYWTNNGLASFSEIITINAGNIEVLTNEIVRNFVNYLQINQGAFFMVEKSDEGIPFLDLKASFAFNRKKFIEKKIKLGEGLLGQVWKDKDKVYITDVPDDYIEITSGLGDAKPRTILMVPLVYQQQVQGIIELASFKEIENYKIEFVDTIAENLAASLASTKNNEQTKQLLFESQEMMEAMQKQDWKMKKSINDLKNAQKNMNTTQSELAEKEANLEAVINNTLHAIIAFDKDYKITVVNRAMRKIYLEKNIVLQAGKNLMEELSIEEIHKNKPDYERVLAGEKFEIILGEEKYAQTFFYKQNFNPIKNELGDIIGASIFIENITQSKMAEMAVKNAQANMNSLINDTEDAIMAVNSDFELIIANERFKERYADYEKAIVLGMNIFDLLDENEAKIWKESFERALKNEHFVKVMNKGYGENKSYVEHWFNPIKDEDDIVTGVSVFSRDITVAKKSELKIKQLLLDSLDIAETMKQQETKMKQKIAAYEIRIKELEGKKVG